MHAACQLRLCDAYGMPAALIKYARAAIYTRLMEAVTVAKKKKEQVNKSKDIEAKPMPRPENLVIDDMVRQQGRHWEISDGTKAEPGRWYNSKRGSLCLLEELMEDGSAKARSHFTGNLVEVPPNQLLYFTHAEDPGTPCGTMLVQNGENGVNGNSEEIARYSDVYTKYPHVIPGSVYKVQNIGTKESMPQWERKRKGKKVEIKGQVRCKIQCQEPGCSNERDIKVQDAFQVKKCEACRDKKKKKNLKKFLDKKKKAEK